MVCYLQLHQQIYAKPYLAFTKVYMLIIIFILIKLTISILILKSIIALLVFIIRRKFYILIPFFIFIFFPRIVSIYLLLLFLSLCICIYYGINSRNKGYFFLSNRLWEFLAGAILKHTLFLDIRK